MKKIRLLKDKFVVGKLLRKGSVRDVTDRTALLYVKEGSAEVVVRKEEKIDKTTKEEKAVKKTK
jgi:hypothetical protein